MQMLIEVLDRRQREPWSAARRTVVCDSRSRGQLPQTGQNLALRWHGPLQVARRNGASARPIDPDRLGRNL